MSTAITRTRSTVLSSTSMHYVTNSVWEKHFEPQPLPIERPSLGPHGIVASSASCQTHDWTYEYALVHGYLNIPQRYPHTHRKQLPFLTSKLLVFLRCDVFQGNISTSIPEMATVTAASFLGQWPLYPLLQAFVRLHRLLCASPLARLHTRCFIQLHITGKVALKSLPLPFPLLCPPLPRPLAAFPSSWLLPEVNSHES